jgi:hypothetical protein
MATTTANKHLAIYLNDHLGGSTGGLELAKRIAGENRGTELGAFMDGLVREIAEDRQTLEDIIAQVGASPDRLKNAIGWAGEKVGRLKLNGSLRGYSPLSRVEELEGLSLGIEGKRLLWVALRESHGERLGEDRLAELARRAERQREGVERFRLQAGHEALAGAPA